MGYNSRYWGNKTQRAKEAQNHTIFMANSYVKEIKESLSDTKIYTDTVEIATDRGSAYPRNTVIDLDSVGAIFKYASGKTCVLNFASYRNPGGKFIEGSKAQEECLCHASFLYNVLKGCMDYYSYNECHRNKGLYTNRALYTPKVLFFNDQNEPLACDVLTCAAPNKSALFQFLDIESKQKIALNDKALRERIKFIKDIVEDNGVDTFIAGAYGCGVFRQDAITVAQLFKSIFEQTTVKNMVYAIPRCMDKSNYDAFIKIFSN